MLIKPIKYYKKQML